MASQRPVCIRWRFGYSSAYRWPLGRTLSRIEKPWSNIESTLAAVSPPSPYICCGDESPMLLVLYILREPLLALSRPEPHSGRRSIRTDIYSVGTYLDAKIDDYDAQLVFLHPHIERMTKKKEQLLAYQEQTWAAIEKLLPYSICYLETRLYTKLDCHKQRDQSGRSTMCSSDMALVIPGEQEISFNSIAGNTNPFSLFAVGFIDHEPPTKVSRDGSPTTALPQRLNACVNPYRKEIHTIIKENLKNVTSSATKILQAALTLQWPRSPENRGCEQSFYRAVIKSLVFQTRRTKDSIAV